MDFNRLRLLISREMRGGASGFFVIFAVVVPLVMSLVVTLLFGSLFSERIQVGVVESAPSQVGTALAELAFVDLTVVDSEAALRQAIADGRFDLGLVIPDGFDAALASGQAVQLDLLVWGQSLAQDRVVFGAALQRIVNQTAGRDLPLQVNVVNLGDGSAMPIEQRLLPFILLMAVMIGGTMVPAASVVEEKQQRTLTALTTTPTRLGEVLLAKALVGAALSVIVSVLTLLLNGAFNGETLLLLLTLALGSGLAAAFGILLGLFIKDTSTLFATIKGLGILLYAPALVYLFQDIPQVIGQVFPTYYIIAPVLILTQEGGGFADIAPHLLVLLVLIALLVAAIGFVIRAPARRERLALA